MKSVRLIAGARSNFMKIADYGDPSIDFGIDVRDLSDRAANKPTDRSEAGQGVGRPSSGKYGRSYKRHPTPGEGRGA